MRGFFIDLEDEEYKETIKNARKKLEVQMKAAMPCKKKNTSYSPCRKLQQGLVGAPDKVPKTKYACIVESHESTRQRTEPTPQKGNENHIAGKGHNSVNHYNLAHTFYPYAEKR